MPNKIKTFDAVISWLMAIVCTLTLMICAFCLIVGAISNRQAGMYLGLHLMNDRQVGMANAPEEEEMIVLAPKVTWGEAVVPQGGRAAALPPSPLTQEYTPKVKDHPLAVFSLAGPSGALAFTGTTDPERRALLNSRKGWNSGILGDGHE